MMTEEAFDEVLGFYENSSPDPRIDRYYNSIGVKTPDSHVILLKQDFALIFRANYTLRPRTIGSITTLFLTKLLKPDSESLASFKISEKGILNLSLPAEYILLNGITVKPNTSAVFLEKYNLELVSGLVLWTEEIILTNKYICPPTININL